MLQMERTVLKVCPNVQNMSIVSKNKERAGTFSNASSWSFVQGAASALSDTSSSSSSISQSDSDCDELVDNEDERDRAGVSIGGGAETM